MLSLIYKNSGIVLFSCLGSLWEMRTIPMWGLPTDRVCKFSFKWHLMYQETLQYACWSRLFKFLPPLSSLMILGKLYKSLGFILYYRKSFIIVTCTYTVSYKSPMHRMKNNRCYYLWKNINPKTKIWFSCQRCLLPSLLSRYVSQINPFPSKFILVKVFITTIKTN